MSRLPDPWFELLDALQLLELAGLITEEITDASGQDKLQVSATSNRPKTLIISTW